MCTLYVCSSCAAALTLMLSDPNVFNPCHFSTSHLIAEFKDKKKKKYREMWQTPLDLCKDGWEKAF